MHTSIAGFERSFKGRPRGLGGAMLDEDFLDSFGIA